MQKNTKAYQMKSKNTGRPVANQILIFEKSKGGKMNIFFQSYDTIICKITTGTGADKITLDCNALEYSRTTSKYLYNFLDNFSIIHAGKRKKEILEAIKNKEIKTKNLN
jgi:hypothetical protein